MDLEYYSFEHVSEGADRQVHALICQRRVNASNHRQPFTGDSNMSVPEYDPDYMVYATKAQGRWHVRIPRIDLDVRVRDRTHIRAVATDLITAITNKNEYEFSVEVVEL